jgi:hypothetical protein
VLQFDVTLNGQTIKVDAHASALDDEEEEEEEEEEEVEVEVEEEVEDDEVDEDEVDGERGRVAATNDRTCSVLPEILTKRKETIKNI